MQCKKSLVATLLLGILLVVGCQQTLPPAEPPPFQGVTLRLACPAQLVELLRTQTAAWQAKQQASLKIIPLEKPLTGPDLPEADLVFFAAPQLARFASTGKLQPLPADLKAREHRYEWANVLTIYRQQLLIWNSKAYALPILGEAPVCIYRSDLYGSAVWQQKFLDWQAKRKEIPGAVRLNNAELRAPSTWEEFAFQAAFFRDQHPLGKSSPSLPPLPKDKIALDRHFYQIAASYARRGVRQDEPIEKYQPKDLFSFHYDHLTGEPLIATPGFVAALEMLVNLHAYRPAVGSDKLEEPFLSGQAVLGIIEAPLLARLQHSPMRDRFGICPIPGSERYFSLDGQEVPLKGGVNRVPYLGEVGWLGAIPTGSKHSEAALDLLTDLSGPTRSTEIVLEPRWGGGPFRADQLLRERWVSYDLDPARMRELKESLLRTLLQYGLKNPLLVLRIPDQESHRDAMVAGLHKALEKKLSPAKCLDEVAQSWRKLDEAVGKTRHLSDYRISLGLLGEK